MYIKELDKMLKEIHNVASQYAGEGVEVSIYQQKKVKCIRIVIPDKTILDIEFRRQINSEVGKHSP
jgi:hypothetical protein